MVESTIFTIDYAKLEVKELIGIGGFGSVYRAIHTDWQIPVAVKKCLEQGGIITEKEKEMFRLEAGRIAPVNHKNVMLLHGMCITPEFYGLVMEYQPNGSLATLLESDVELPWSLRCQFIHETSEGMNFLHKLGPYQLLHMDLKVANLLLNGFMEIKISDFGVSKIRTDSVVTTTKGAGTTTHIPPEHLKDPDRPVSEKFDVYSFAIVIWEITTRNKPYKGAFNIEHIKTSVAMFEARPNLDDVPVDAPRGLKELMVKCWDKDPVKRPHFNVILPQVKRIAESFDEDMLIVVSDVIRNLKLIKSGKKPTPRVKYNEGAMQAVTVKHAKHKEETPPRRFQAASIADQSKKEKEGSDTSLAAQNRMVFEKAKERWDKGRWKGTMELNGESGPVKFEWPSGVTTTHLGQVVIAATASHSVLTFNSKYELDSEIRFDGKFPKEFQPFDVAVTTTNEYFMSDTGNHQVVVYQQNSKTTQIFCQHDNINPKCIALLHEGFVVTDSKGKRVVKYDMNGESVAEVKGQGQKGQIINPWGVVVNSVNNVLVSDWGSSRGDGSIKVYNDQLHFLFSLVDGLYLPHGLSVDLWDNVYSIQRRSLRGSHRWYIVKYTKNGEEVKVFGDNLYHVYWGYIAVCKHHNDPRIIVSQPRSNRIQVYTK